jgi:hypothetical protein
MKHETTASCDSPARPETRKLACVLCATVATHALPRLKNMALKVAKMGT